VPQIEQDVCNHREKKRESEREKETSGRNTWRSVIATENKDFLHFQQKLNLKVTP